MATQRIQASSGSSSSKYRVVVVVVSSSSSSSGWRPRGYRRELRRTPTLTLTPTPTLTLILTLASSLSLTQTLALAQAGEEIYASYGESYWKARGIDPETGKPLPAAAPAGAPSASDL